MNLVEGPGNLTDLVEGIHVYRVNVDRNVIAVGLAHAPDRLGQPDARHLERSGAQPPQRPHHRPADDDREQQREHEHEQDGGADDDRRDDRLLAQVLGAVDGLRDQSLLDGADLDDRLRHVAEPLLGNDPDLV